MLVIASHESTVHGTPSSHVAGMLVATQKPPRHARPLFPAHILGAVQSDDTVQVCIIPESRPVASVPLPASLPLPDPVPDPPVSCPKPPSPGSITCESPVVPSRPAPPSPPVPPPSLKPVTALPPAQPAAAAAAKEASNL
jgi:hypothetical protein